MFFNLKKKRNKETPQEPSHMPKMHHCLNPQAFTIYTNYTLVLSFFFSCLSSYYHLSPFSFKSHYCLLNLNQKLFFLSSLCSILGWRRIIELDHLATLTREKCSALVRSCYVPSRTTCSSDDIITKQNTKVEDGLGFRGGRRLPNNQPSKRHGGGRSCTAVSSEPCNLKSNLKVKTEVDKGLEQRKVSWPDAHGKDFAHVQEFDIR